VPLLISNAEEDLYKERHRSQAHCTIHAEKFRHGIDSSLLKKDFAPQKMESDFLGLK
jgi:hypothetical protein